MADDVPERYVRRVVEEIGERLTDPPMTVYLGGGTPSILSQRLLDALLHGIPLERCEELTIETNPEDVTVEFCKWLKNTPINRVSMGVQSLDSALLKAIGRRHTAPEAVEAYRRLREVAEIRNISLDLIYGLPGQDLISWQQSLEGLLVLRPEHLSAYLLSYEPGTVLTRRLEQGRVSEASPELASQMYDVLSARAGEEGYEHYEISNFALPGLRARHNSHYWDGTPYLGVGIGAHSLMPDGVRCYHASDLKRYLADGWRATLTEDVETAIDRFNDFIITRLRTAEGLDLDECRRLHGSRLTEALVRTARTLDSLALTPTRIAIPKRLWLTSDTFLRALMQ